MALRLLELRSDADVLAQVGRWYSAPEVRRWMGDEFDFPTLIASKLGTSTPRIGGSERLDTLGWVGLNHDGRPVAFMGGDLTIKHAGSHHLVAGRMVELDMRTPPTLGFTYVVAPEHRGKGHGREMVRAVLEHPSARDIEEFSCTVSVQNHASLALLRGIPEFSEVPSPVQTSGKPDSDASLEFRYARSGA